MNTELARRQMVNQQIRTWDVFDPDVLDTLAGISREDYVPGPLKDCAYADVEIPIGHGQCMLRPSIVGRILQAVDIQPGDTVLEIGTGTGYLTHCLATFANSVVSIDKYAEFADGARNKLAEAGLDNVTVDCMDASTGLPAGDFDVIVVTAAMPEVDSGLVEALRTGGRLFVVVGESPAMTATLVTREDDDTTTTELFETDIPPLVTSAERSDFTF